ncbi:MAG: hypothetical protein HUU16_16840 [Candidatus Omnitrophica bacterium]|nr:hypothetical protein [Candidatus Omnitrophota bacterium]
MDLHNSGGTTPKPHVWKGMPVTELINNTCNFASPKQTSDAMFHAIRDRKSRIPGFYFFRIVWTPPTSILESLDVFRKEHPEIDIEVVDPYNFFALFKRHQEALSAPPAKPATLYVSALGDNSDGSSWKKAFRSVQKALDSVPNDQGGHRILIRPDTYMEPNLHPSRKGAAGAYNTLEADFDGSLGSGATGYAIMDSGDPERGQKSVDWWGPFKSDPQFSAIGWDRWVIRHLYVAGGDAGLFWDFPPKIAPFSIVVEDSIGIGRAFGGGAAHFLARPDEPVLFRRCNLWCLDWWGDAAGAYVRAENSEMPATPDVTFEDCALVGPDNALQAGNPGYGGFSRVRLKGCRLVSLNFSQPRGTPGTGIIHSTIEGRFLQVDLEDCTLMGYKVFGAGKGDIGYSARGDVKAYVQYEQEVPKGIHRLGAWPTDTFASIFPPTPPSAPRGLKIQDSPLNNLCESAPLVWNGRLILMECVRPAGGGELKDYAIRLVDSESGTELARFAEGYGLACGLVSGDKFHVFASRHDPAKGTWNDVTHFSSSDLKKWDSKVVIEQESEHLFNTSVTASPEGFVMAYESDDPTYPAFTIKFARSTNLEEWTKIPKALFGVDRYTACPCLRHVDGYYYMLYLEHRSPRWFFETYAARSRDLVDWELSSKNPVLSPGKDEGINASDPDLTEFQGRTILYYSVGDQRTWSRGKVATYPGSLREFFSGFF